MDEETQWKLEITEKLSTLISNGENTQLTLEEFVVDTKEDIKKINTTLYGDGKVEGNGGKNKYSGLCTKVAITNAKIDNLYVRWTALVSSVVFIATIIFNTLYEPVRNWFHIKMGG